ncbi:MAG: BRCT domain-containing protein [Pirellulaceae bacterium]
MATLVQLIDVRSALAARDPSLVDLLIQFVQQDLDRIVDGEPELENVYNFPKFFEEIQSRQFRRKSLEEQKLYRQQRVAELEAADSDSATAGTAASVRFHSHEILTQLWQANDSFSRDCLLRLIAELPLVYGPWKALKQIFKEAEAKHDTVIYGALGARFDVAFADNRHGVSKRTLGYLCRRAWRYLRRVAQTLPSVYPDVVNDFLIRYRSEDFHDTNFLTQSWILNHIFFHETKQYNGGGFLFGCYVNGQRIGRRPTSWLKHRAFVDAWRRSPRPLFALLQSAQCEPLRQYAATALKSEFRATLREIQPSWVSRLVSVGSGSIDEFVIWILENVPRFEQAKFRELGLHDAALQLFDSNSASAAKFAAEYARTHARDLSVQQLIRLVSNHHQPVSKLAIDLLKSLDPRKDVGLEAWGRLLESDSGSKVAADMLQKHFTGKEMTPKWFTERLLHGGHGARDFAIRNLTRLHSLRSLGTSYFIDLMLDADPASDNLHFVTRFAAEQLEKIGLGAIDTQALQRMLIHPTMFTVVVSWEHQGLLEAKRFEADFLKRIAFKPTYETEPLVIEAHQSKHADHYQYNPTLAEYCFRWLSDVRQFLPDELGFEWLMELVKRNEPEYHNFAVQAMSKAFLPADFAPTDSAATKAKLEDKPDGEINVDLDGASFVFTGKLATMTRAEAKKKVTTAGGANSSSVNKKLDYLVIGDEGSPLYGQGRKGSKQLKGEELIEEGSPMRIISETAFLQMLAGEQREFSEDAVDAGCQRLWEMMTQAEKEDDPLARFARSYFRNHHKEICLKETDRPVDPGAEIPDSFLTFQQVKPLFADSRVTLRSLAMEFAQYEFVRWAPPIDGIVEMCETPHAEVRDFVAKALTCDEAPEHRRYRLGPDVLTADAVYRFCESRDAKTRALGMLLIQRHPRLQLPEELFRLTESPDAQVRGFVIRTFWSLYRDRGITDNWHPSYFQTKSTVGTKKKPLTEDEIAAKIGAGPPDRPESLPAETAQIQELLRRVLFELPPGPPPRTAKPEARSSSKPEKEKAKDDSTKLKPLPARMSKLNLVETIRDLAIEDASFAEVVLPVLTEFMDSRGKSEQAACIVAVTRIRKSHDLPMTELQEVTS